MQQLKYRMWFVLFPHSQASSASYIHAQLKEIVSTVTVSAMESVAS